MYKLVIPLFFLLHGMMLYADSTRTLKAERAISEINIDAHLNEQVWYSAEVAMDFVTREPVKGLKATYSTEVMVAYDDHAIYIGARMYDPHPDSILRQLSFRDDDGVNADRFYILIDTYNEKQNVFAFSVSATGVQTDFRGFEDIDDYNWNAVWESAVDINENGWTVEIRIPYSALRFPDLNEQLWGVNFGRVLRRTRENSTWQPVDEQEASVLTQLGLLTGIKNIKTPVRLSLMPYVAAYLEHFPFNEENKSNYSWALRGGLDLKYGISESFTLDMTLVPDFGQVQSDNIVLNLSPYEVAYEEKRPFFTEGTDLFQTGDLFYTRRVGGTPLLYDRLEGIVPPGTVIIDNPAETQLLNATKFSGRTSDGLGIGIFNAIANRTKAVVKYADGEESEYITQPVTNYNVIVVNKTLKNNSSASFVNTNTWRNGPYEDANVSGIFFNLKDAPNQYGVTGSGVVSLTNMGTPEPEGTITGHKYHITAGKFSGRLRYSATQLVRSHEYDINDLGFLASNNAFNHTFFVAYNLFKPIGPFVRINNGLNIYYNNLYAPRTFTYFATSWSTFFLTREYLGAGTEVKVQPGNAYDYFEPRVKGRYFIQPGNFSTRAFISTDYRKKLAWDVSILFLSSPKWNEREFTLSINPRIRLSDQIMLYPQVNIIKEKNDRGFAGISSGNDIIFGNRDITTITTAANGSYIFNNKMGIQLDLRHYWSKAAYDRYFTLQHDGNLQPTYYSGIADINFNIFTLDIAYIWEFAPGSELSVVWKNQIINAGTNTERGYLYNYAHTLSSPQSNSLSVKLLYYFDYLYIQDKVEPLMQNLF